MAHRETRHADHAQSNFCGARGRSAQHDDRFDPRLVDEAVAKPDGFEYTGLLGEPGSIENRVDFREPEKHAAIGQAETPFDGQIAHGLSPSPVLGKR